MTDSSEREPRTKEDVVVVHSMTEDGRGWNVLRRREGRLEAGAMRPVVEGQPLHGEVVKLVPREGVPEGAPVFDVEVLYAGEPSKSGPAQVATRAYRANWDTIFAAPRDDDDHASN